MPVVSVDDHFAFRTKDDYERMAREIERVVDWLRQRPAPGNQRAEALARIAADIRRDTSLPARPDSDRADADIREKPRRRAG